MRPIDADYMKEHIEGSDVKTIKTIMEWIDNQPTIEPQRMRGKWIPAGKVKWLRDDGKPTIIECSLCHKSVINNGKTKWNYCPNCGADMRGEQE